MLLAAGTRSMAGVADTARYAFQSNNMCISCAMEQRHAPPRKERRRAHHFSSMLPRLENWAMMGAPLNVDGKAGSRFKMARSRVWPAGEGCSGPSWHEQLLECVACCQRSGGRHSNQAGHWEEPAKSQVLQVPDAGNSDVHALTPLVHRIAGVVPRHCRVSEGDFSSTQRHNRYIYPSCPFKLCALPCMRAKLLLGTGCTHSTCMPPAQPKPLPPTHLKPRCAPAPR